MLSQNIFIVNSRTLYDILIELKNLLNFNILHMNEKDLNKNTFDDYKNYILLTNDRKNLEKNLKKFPKSQPKIIAFESVYSMDGNFSPIKEICDLAKKYNALTFLDEVDAALDENNVEKFCNILLELKKNTKTK